MRPNSGWLTVAAVVAACLAGCGGNEPEPEPERPPARRAEPADTPDGVLAPVDAWTEALAAQLPAPWKLDGIDSQVEAPEGYTRVAGGRGLLLRLSGGPDRQQRFWVMPRGFEAVADPGTKTTIEVVAETDELLLFAPASPAWEHTPKVIEALGMRPVEKKKRVS
jgi:hypothetical protein